MAGRISLTGAGEVGVVDLDTRQLVANNPDLEVMTVAAVCGCAGANLCDRRRNG